MTSPQTIGLIRAGTMGAGGTHSRRDAGDNFVAEAILVVNRGLSSVG
jgi:hypothetical protein